MANHNLTLSEHKALPISDYPLADIDSLNLYSMNALDSVFIEPSSHAKIGPATDDMLKLPIQVCILNIGKGEALLGIHTPTSLVLKRGPESTPSWEEACLNLVKNHRQYNQTTQPKQTPQMPSAMDLWCVESNARDELSALVEAHYAFYQMLDALFDSEETRLAMDWPLAQLGFTQWKDWLLMRFKKVQRMTDTANGRVSKQLSDSQKNSAYLCALLKSMSLPGNAEHDGLLDRVAAAMKVDRAEVDLFIQDITLH